MQSDHFNIFLMSVYFTYFDIVSDNLSAFIGNAMTLCGYEIRFMLYGASNPAVFVYFQITENPNVIDGVFTIPTVGR